MIIDVKSTLYTVSVPVLSTYSQMEIEIYGLPVGHNFVNGEIKKNTEGYQDMVTVQINLKKIIKTYMEGYPINIISEDDMKEVFTKLTEILNFYNNNTRKINALRYNKSPITKEELIAIDSLCEDIWENNKGFITLKQKPVKKYDEFSPVEIDTGEHNDYSRHVYNLY